MTAVAWAILLYCCLTYPTIPEGTAIFASVCFGMIALLTAKELFK